MAPVVNAGPLPVLNRLKPRLYFIQMEAQFLNAQIINDIGKYSLIVASLDSEILEVLSENPLFNSYIKYDQLKDLIMKTCADLENSKVCKRLQEGEFEADKPSQLLHKMRDFVNGAVYEEDLKRLWLERLPESVRGVVSTTIDLERCAEQADKIVELNSFPRTAQMQITNESTTCDLNAVMEAIKTLSNDLAELKSSQSSSIDCKMHNDSESAIDVENKDNVIGTSENIDNIRERTKMEVLKAVKKKKLSKDFCNFLYSEMDKLDMTFDDIQEEISILMKVEKKKREKKQDEQKLCTLQTISQEGRPCTSRTISESEYSVINNDSLSVSMLSLSQDEE
ncbi:uncharacterized protein LOC119684193 [Teleopsis dalmanni]|uniref:uncharacterized protein LOC119684193 n=1 Tax=Teleopsis dalmanni TaxID=139649 RepID=UPI0018CFA109|nr:uncharacterized protein LOC119684193 [Teleopsis dalmanni]